LECGGFSAAVRALAQPGLVDFFLNITRQDCQKSENVRQCKRDRRRLNRLLAASNRRPGRLAGARRRRYSGPGTTQKSVYFLVRSGYLERSFC
jgi:hypothetical protein